MPIEYVRECHVTDVKLSDISFRWLWDASLKLTQRYQQNRTPFVFISLTKISMGPLGQNAVEQKLSRCYVGAWYKKVKWMKKMVSDRF